MENNLDELRDEIDIIDGEMCGLFIKRMEIAREIAVYKKENGLPVVNLKRESEIIEKLTKNQSGEMAFYIKPLFQAIFGLSSAYQGNVIAKL